jgi:carbonic anhydrase
MTFDQDIKKLITGNHKFKAKFFDSNNNLFNELVEFGQKPKIMVITCSDSRIDPAMIFGCQPGELFVVRNIANLIPPYEDNDTYHGTSAALEFGTCFLDIKHIIILGHTSCGGIRSLIENTNQVLDKKNYSFVAKWMDLAKPAYDRVTAEHSQATLEEKIILCEQLSLVNSLKNLVSFPWIQRHIANHNLSIHAWYFDLATGVIHAHDQENNNWQTL